jgi:hypothetical protein
MGTCFECDENFDLPEGVDIGDTVSCPKCGFKYEVLNTFPVSLDYAAPDDDEVGP